MKLVSTQDWTLEQLMPYSPQITAALRKLREKFPDDGTLDSYAQDLVNGSLHLWLMLDGEDFKGIVMTQVKTVEATGHKALIVAGCAGEDGVELTPHIDTLEEWARNKGLNSVQPIGRVGWKKPLEKLGYKIDRVVYRKAI